MSGIEKMFRLSLALDKVYRHGRLHLAPEIANKEMVTAIWMLQKAISNTPGWAEFIEKQTNAWINYDS